MARAPYVGNKPWIGRLIMLIVAAPIAEAQVAVNGSAHHVRIVVILPVILPPADLAQFLGLRHRERSITTALAAGRSRSSHLLVSMRWIDVKSALLKARRRYEGNAVRPLVR